MNSPSLTAVIVDDEESSHLNLQNLLHKEDLGISIIGNALNVEAGIELINQRNPDIIFLDIKMEDGTGFDLLQQIEFIKYSIVFISAHNEYARLAIDFAAMAYLDKPIAPEKLSDAIKRAKDRMSLLSPKQRKEDVQEVIQSVNHKSLPSRIKVSNSSGQHYIPIDEITYITVDSGCTEIHQLNGGRETVSANLVTYQKKFAKYTQFMRVHRSYIVNLCYVRTHRPSGIAILQNDVEIPISSRHQEEFEVRLDEL